MMILGVIFVILLNVLSGELCRCENNASPMEKTEVLGHDHPDFSNSSETGKTTKVLPLGAEKTMENKLRLRRLEPAHINGSAKHISKNLLFLSPTFTLSSDKILGDRCILENDFYLSELEELKLWAVKMHDSSGKLTSGFLNGNVNQFGDFDQCVNAQSPDGLVQGKYCLAYFQIKMRSGHPENERVRKIFDLMQSHHAFRSTLGDPGHRVPRFSTINWALCIPSSCTNEDLESQLKDLIQRHTVEMNIDIEVRVDKEMCHVKKQFQPTVSFVAVSLLLLSVAATVLISTAKDFLSEVPLSPKKFLTCFSLKRNLKQLMSTERVTDDIQSIHGIRMINAILLLLSHKSMAMFFFPFTNRTYMVESLSQPWTILARVASLYTDSFIMISGILTAYSFCKTLKKNGYLDIKKEYINRMIRIVPLLIVTVLISTFIIPELGSGPQWGLTVAHHSNSCKKSGWKNFLFVHNYFGFENMCLTHTHHLGIDTQLFFLSPILVYILHKWQFAGITCLVTLAAVSTGLRYQSTVSENLSYFIYPGITVNQMIRTANFSYIIPSHRLTVYVIGLIIGYILQYYGREFKIKSHSRRILWTAAFGLIYYIILKTTSMSALGYAYDKYEAAAYSALAPIAWCVSLGWIIFASHINCGGMLGRIFSAKYWMIWTKISYAVYLVQFPIFFYNVGMQRYPQEFSIYTLINIWEYSSVLIAAVVLTLFFDMPINNIRKLLR